MHEAKISAKIFLWKQSLELGIPVTTPTTHMKKDILLKANNHL